MENLFFKSQCLLVMIFIRGLGKLQKKPGIWHPKHGEVSGVGNADVNVICKLKSLIMQHHDTVSVIRALYNVAP